MKKVPQSRSLLRIIMIFIMAGIALFCISNILVFGEDEVFKKELDKNPPETVEISPLTIEEEYANLDESPFLSNKEKEYYKQRIKDSELQYNDYFQAAYNTLIEIGINENTSKKDAYSLIVSYVCKRAEYDYNFEKYHWTDIIDSGSSVCNGYAQIIQVLCKMCNIECYKVDGYASSDDGEYVYHAWNYVYLNGKWYWSDITWKDSTGNNIYFLSEDLWASHVPKKFHSIIEPNIYE